MDYPPPYPASSISNGTSEPVRGVGLDSMTFLPEMIAERSVHSDRPEYELFPALVEKANEFLRSHPQYTVNTCESVEFPARNKGTTIESETSTFIYYGESNNRCIRALRVWLQRAVNRETPYDQIGYVNFLPRIDSNGSVERLDSLIVRINGMFGDSPLPGQIITIETQPIKWGSRGPNPDESIWTERGNTNSTFINLIRIFYIIGPSRNERIGLSDFVPQEVEDTESSCCPDLRMESFEPVMQRAQSWLMTVPPNYRPVNVQSVVFRWSFNKGIDTLDMSYTEHKLDLRYLRYIRVAYIIEDIHGGPVSRQTMRLNCKLFAPELLQEPGCCDAGEFETAKQAKERIYFWAEKSGAKIVSVETIAQRAFRGGHEGYDSMYTWNSYSSGKNSRRHDEQFVILYRVYTDGNFPDITFIPRYQATVTRDEYSE